MKSYLVTGGAGFIGSNFINYMLNKYKDIKIINLDLLTYAGNLENLKQASGNANYKFVKGNICDEALVSKIFEEEDIDFVVNFAAESHVDRSILDPLTFSKSNVLGVVNLLNVAKKFWQIKEDEYKAGAKFVQISTDEVYGSLGSQGYFTELTPLDPHSPYSSSKAGGDMVAKAYYDTYNFPVSITRCSNNYGPYQFPEKLIPLTILKVLNHQNVPVYGDGLNIRDWLYVEDHCKAVDLVIQKGRLGQVYNIGGHNEMTNVDIVKLIISYINEKYDSDVNEDLVTFVKDRKGHDRRYGIDPTKIKNELGWSPAVFFQEGIKKTIDWYLSNKNWLERVISGEYQKNI